MAQIQIFLNLVLKLWTEEFTSIQQELLQNKLAQTDWALNKKIFLRKICFWVFGQKPAKIELKLSFFLF